VPLTEKGEKIKGAMTKQYGEKKGEEVFYASKNAGKISGVDAAKDDDNQHMGFNKGEAPDVEKLVSLCDALSTRMDAFEKRRAMKRPVDVKPRTKDNMQPSMPQPKAVREPGAA
jgi:hypothetical protein